MAYFCEDCGRAHTNVTRPLCGKSNTHRRPHPDDEPVSVADDSLDTMIEQASRPTLASLLKRGIDSGLIKPSHEYAAGSTPTS